MAHANGYGQNGQPRILRPDEINEARKVFQNSVDYQNVYIRLPVFSNDGAVTAANYETDNGRWIFQIYWTIPVYRDGAVYAREQNTLIHEMTHVWQGQHGVYPTVYMLQSGWSQLKDGVKDIWDKGEWQTWGDHRSTTYRFR